VVVGELSETVLSQKMRLGGSVRRNVRGAGNVADAKMALNRHACEVFSARETSGISDLAWLPRLHRDRRS
jgi:hypothetical protein